MGLASRRPAVSGRGSNEGVGARIIRSAHELFVEKGYHATTTKEISVRAGVAEPTLFRRFGSKADIFEASTLQTVTEFVERWSHSWVEYAPQATFEDMAEDLVDGLYTLIMQNRPVFRELMVALPDPNDDLHNAALVVTEKLRQGLRSVHDAGRRIETERGLLGLDPPATVATIASMIIGAALLGDWVFPAGLRRPGRTRMVREMALLIADGVAHRD